MRPLRLQSFLLAAIGVLALASCGKSATSSGVEGTNAAAKQSWYTPLSPALQDELRQRALSQTELSESDETES